MNIFTDIQSIQNHLSSLKASGQSYAFVPTMGHLHQGHLDLVELAKTLTDNIVVSIYVNPLQFGANEDLGSYPRTFDSDIEKLEALDVNCVFAPNDSIMYPDGKDKHTKVSVPELSDDHCGKSRPQFFGGITTVVTKLFNIIQADFSIFGEKDFQQLAILRKMVDDLHIPTKIISLPIVRCQDGLALSSRNSYLTPIERKAAPLLYQTLKVIKRSTLNGEEFRASRQSAIDYLEGNGFIVDYLNICDAKTLKPACKATQDIVILAAAMLGNTRLIDNTAFSLNAPSD